MQLQSVDSIITIGAAVRKARKALHLTQEQAAALCGVSMPFMNQLEGGKRQHLSITRVLKVCSALGLRLHLSGSAVASPSGAIGITGLQPLIEVSKPNPKD
jgi:HTH-type transcriptional regulator/antitoxin HipB